LPAASGRSPRAGDDGEGDAYPAFKPVRALLPEHPQLHPPIVDGLLREGETLNLIAPSKTRKSWLALHLACCVATGRPWLDFPTRAGRVLILDNELHAATIANRIPRVAEALGIPLDQLADTLCVESFRGKLRDIFGLRSYFRVLRGFKLVVLDSLYRFLPREADENSNAGMAAVYNALDKYAQDGGFAFVCVHHSSKGIQAGKALTDVGAGAGAMARATDAHLVLRDHEQEDCVAVEAVTRSFPPPAAFCLLWAFPVWTLAPELDPADLRTSWGRRRAAAPAEEAPPKPEVTLDSFMAACGGSEAPRLRDEVLDTARRELGLSLAQARRWFDAAREGGRLHEWGFGATRKRKYATVPQSGSLL